MLRKVTLLLVASLFFAPCVRAESLNALSDDEKKDGFELLFNGSDLEGWNQAGNWKVADGAFGRADKGGGITYKVKTIPDNFDLKFDWKVGPGSNSGVYYRPGQYEYQVLDNAKHGDGKNPRTSAASLYFCMPPAKDVTRPVGEWNSGRIICQGTVIQHWLNGIKVVDFDYTDPRYAFEVELLDIRGADLSRRGAQLHLQDHGDPVWYRNVKLRTLTEEIKLDRTPITPAAVPEEKLKYEREYLEKGKQQRAEQKAKAEKK